MDTLVTLINVCDFTVYGLEHQYISAVVMSPKIVETQLMVGIICIPPPPPGWYRVNLSAKKL